MSCVSAVTPTTSDIEIGLKVPIPIDSNDAKEFYPNVESNNWDPSIEKETPHFMLLILNKDGKANMLRAIEECYASKEEKAWMADFLQKMWEKYPAKFEKSDGSIYISIEGKEKGLGLTDEEKKGLEKVDFEITRYLNDLFSDDNSPKWSANEHSMIVNDSCHKWYVNEQLCRLAAQYAPGPDSWWSFPYNLINHYWNPDLPFIGQGRYYFDAYADISKTYYDDGNPGAAFCVLGWSSHFLTDLGNPLHTGKEAEQLWQGVYPNLPLYSWVHNNYEGYVNQYWSTPPPSGDYSFSYYVTNNWYY